MVLFWLVSLLVLCRFAESLVTDGVTTGTHGGWSETSHLHSSGAPIRPLWACDATPCGRSRPSESFLSRFEELVHAESARFMFATGGVLSEGYGHGGPGVCLGDGQTEAEGVLSVAYSGVCPHT